MSRLMKRGPSGDDLELGWASEKIGGLADAEVSKRSQKKAQKRARLERLGLAAESGREGEGGSGGDDGDGGGGAAAAVTATATATGGAAAAAAATGGGGRRAFKQLSASDSVVVQAEGLWGLFRASPSGRALTQLEYIRELSGGMIARHGCESSSSLVCNVVKEVLPGWGKLVGTRGAAAPRPKASPALLILTHSATRACELIKQLAPFSTRVAKLFAKHITLEEASAALRQGPPCVFAVGTPPRVMALLEGGHLQTSHLVTVLLDTVPDVKGMNVVTMFGVRDELWDLYFRFLHRGVVGGNCKLALLE